MEKVSYLFSAEVKESCVASTDSGAMLGSKEATVTDSELFIRQTFETDPKFGYELLYRHYYKGLCSHAMRFVYSKSIAEDIVSDILYQFYLKDIFKKISFSYRAFLYKSVRNKAYNYLRLEAKGAVELDHIHNNISAATSQQPDSVIQYEELCHEVESAIKALPTKCRKIYLMHRFEDKRYIEIAEELQLSPRTVEVQIRKASQFLKQVLSKNWIFFIVITYNFC